MYKLSVCFTVYNQIEILQEHLNMIVPVVQRRDDIEILVSDDCSTQDIYSLVTSYACTNLHYKRTEKNLGHDLNILHAIENAEADYVMILRTRDNIYTPNLDLIVNTLEQNMDAGYYLFSAMDGKGNLRLNLNDRLYPHEKSCNAHFSLFVHPSGSIYNRRFLNVEKYREYIMRHFDTVYGFEVHELIRCDLSFKSQFITSNVIGWIYADTLSATDTAVNSTKSGKNVYTPEYWYPRYKCYLDFVTHEIPEDVRSAYICDAINRYYYSVVARAKTMSNDRRYNAHYNSKGSKINRKDVAEVMDNISYDYLKDVSGSEMVLYKKQIMKSRIKCLYRYPLYELIRNILVETGIYKLYRNYIGNRKVN